MNADPLRGLPLAIATAAVLLLGAGSAGVDSLPSGGRDLLLQVAGAPAQLRDLVRQKRSEQEWLQWIREAARGKALGDQQQATLAAYLAVNMPAPAAARDPAALPRDGRDLTRESCQPCHSQSSAFLAHHWSAERWRSTFLAPFHRTIRMTPQEREEFARYAEINLPLNAGGVP